MPSSAKDVLPEAGGSAGSTTTDVQGSQPDATGAEIAVTLHASRYSAASKGAAKLPPIHEDTRTVIIFPQGAVVRLSASVTPGELVVLTNNRTGTDVICRVTSVKAQPGIQNYVHLEFTQRALDFWEGVSSGGQGTVPGKTSAAAPSAAVSAPRTPVFSADKAASSLEKEAPRASKSSASEAEVEVRVPKATPEITPLADLPAGGSSDISVKAADAARSPRVAHDSARETRNQTDALPEIRFQPFDAQRPRRSKSLILVGMAAAVVIVMGIVAGPELWRQYGPLILTNRSAVATTSVPSEAPLQSNQPTMQNPAQPAPDQPFANAAVKNPPERPPVPEPVPVQPVAETAKPEPQPKAVRPALNVGKLSAPKLKKAALATSNEPPPVLSVDSGALPAALGETAAGAANGLPAPQPTAPPPPRGGNLQQPKLLSTVAAVYPDLARAQHVQGDVSIDALIDANGKVSATNVLTGNALLQKAATDALRLWKYQPATLNGQPIPIHIKVTITFHLN